MIKHIDNSTIKPPLKWAGGKRWLASYICPLFENHKQKRLIEPFCGGLAITLNLMPKQTLLNDINPHLINFYNHLKTGLTIALKMHNDQVCYYNSRNRFNKLISANNINCKESADLFYYLNRTGYNGLCRFNSKGYFNVPFGKHKEINYVTNFTHYATIFNNWNFSCFDFEELNIKSGDFIYADPPYDVEFTQYSKENFSWNDQLRLVRWLAKHKGPVALSNQATKRIVKLYEEYGFTLQYVNAPRMISCDGNRTPSLEVLAIKGMH